VTELVQALVNDDPALRPGGTQFDRGCRRDRTTRREVGVDVEFGSNNSRRESNAVGRGVVPGSESDGWVAAGIVADYLNMGTPGEAEAESEAAGSRSVVKQFTQFTTWRPFFIY
jgi:hypothetical protein